MDVISHHVVNTLHLETEQYTGDAIRPMGAATNIYMPERKESQGQSDVDLDQWQPSYDAGADKAITPTGSSFGVTDSEISTNRVNIPQGFRNTCEINVSHLGRLIDAPLTAVLDTVSEINLIDFTTVEKLGLTKSKCQRNTKNFNSKFFTATGWEVLIDWHVAGFEKQYNDTFLVVNLKASGYEDDVILGQDTIREVGFFFDAADTSSEVPSLTTGSTLSTASLEEFQEAAEEVAELFLQDPVLNPLYHKALGVFKINEFERKFAKLLRGFASELLTESINDIHKQAVRFLKTRTNLIVSHMGHRLDPEKTKLAQRFQQLANQKPKKIMQSDALDKNEVVELELPELAAASNSGSSEPEVPENSYLYHRELVRSFILHSTALSNLRESFGRFVLQSHFKVKSSANATADSSTTVEEEITRTLGFPSKDDEDKPAEPIDAPSKRVTLDELRIFSFANIGRCIQLMFQIAEFLELRFDEGQEYRTTRDQRFTGLRNRGYSNNNTEIPVESRKWVLPIYHSERYRMKVEHVDVHKTVSDFEMFQSIKKRYYESKSTTKRLLAMRGVKEIKFVKLGTQTGGDAIPDEEAASAVGTVNHGSGGLQNADPYCYIFLRTPKKLGEPLIADDRATPEAWASYPTLARIVQGNKDTSAKPQRRFDPS
ncbi:MAG: hypothetical protein Q9204_001332 [Flavoplaca sp. TL-2023a]